LVVRGAFELRLASRQPSLVTAGELALVTSGAPHRLSEGSPSTVVPLLEAMRGRARGEGQTALVCGAFVMHDTRFNPLFAALPDVLRVAIATPSAGPLGRGITELLVTEVSRGGAGRPWVVSRLLELLCAEAIGSVEARTLRGPNWLKAMRDPSLGAALDAFHRAPASSWTVVRLAKRAALSPSRFAARFRELLGESPMAYVTAWRLTIAARLLRDSSQRIDEVGRSIGYDSLPAFSRAFKRQWGKSPSAMRTR
jgi:AraC-like DNA-binding protein